jgi:hypothetical protein
MVTYFSSWGDQPLQAASKCSTIHEGPGLWQRSGGQGVGVSRCVSLAAAAAAVQLGTPQEECYARLLQKGQVCGALNLSWIRRGQLRGVRS